MTVAETFALLASISLILHFFKDVKTLMIDERRNWFMQGATISLILIAGAFWHYFPVLLVVYIFNAGVSFAEKRLAMDILGDGDKQIMAWLVPGLVLFGLLYSAAFLAVFGLTLLALFIAKKAIKIGAFPGLSLICIAWAVVGWLYFVNPLW